MASSKIITLESLDAYNTIFNIKYEDLDLLALKVSDKIYYINATKLCSDNNKSIRDWARNQYSRQLIKTLDKTIDPQKCIVKINTGSNNFRGKFFHPNLIPYLLKWLKKDVSTITNYSDIMKGLEIELSDIIYVKHLKENILYHVTITSTKGLIHKVGVTSNIDDRMKIYTDRYNLETVTLVTYRTTKLARAILYSISENFQYISNKNYYLFNDEELIKFNTIFMNDNLQ